MKKLYFVMMAALVALTVNAQLTNVYSTDFSDYATNGHILAYQVGGNNIWTGSNQIWVTYNELNGAMCMKSTWRGASLSGYPIENWTVGNSVKISLSVNILELTGFKDDDGRNKEMVFGITERVAGGGNGGSDSPSPGTGVTVGFDLRDLASTEDELEIRLINATGQNTTLTLAESDVINFVFVATKTVSGMDVKLDVSKNAGAITTLSATDVVDTAHPVYVNAGSNTAFTAYYKLPFNVGYLPDGLNSLSWDNLSLEYGTDPTTNLNDEIAADNILVIGNTLYTTDVEDKAYKLYNLSGAVVSEGEITGTSVFLDVPKGLYIVKIGSTSKKVMIK